MPVQGMSSSAENRQMDPHHYLANYEIDQEIGQGSFATVFLGHEKTTKAKVAVKAVNTAKLNKKLAENLASEITILKEIDHPNIIKLFEIQKTENYIYLVMEYCEAGDLSQHLRKNRVIKEVEAQSLLQQLTSALKVLWENNLIHRDLKPQNLLLQNDPNHGLVLKIADFGFARYVEPTDLAETLCGSPLYMAPEILRYEKYDAKADLWSVGAIAYEMVFGAPPYRADNHVHLLRVIDAADDSSLPFPTSLTFKQSLRRASSTPSKFSKDKQAVITINIETSDIFRDLLLKLLKKDPNKRIAFEEYFKHAFVSESFTRPSKLISKHVSSECFAFIPSKFSGSPLAESRRSSQSTTTSLSSTVEEVLKLEDENSLLLELFENIEKKPPLFSIIKNCLTLVLMLDKVISQESNQSMSISVSRLSDQRKAKSHSVILLLYYNIDLLENCLEILKTAINRESEKGTVEFGDLLKAARAVSVKLDSEYDLFDTIKATLRLQSSASAGSISASSLPRSNSSQSISEEASSPKIETLILQSAFKFAKEAGIQELLEQVNEARIKYFSAIFLLKSLISPTESAPITSKFAQIQMQQAETLNSYLDLIQERLK